ncbi:MAG: hypothetical protein ACOYKN_17940 [Pirellula sp.]
MTWLVGLLPEKQRAIPAWMQSLISNELVVRSPVKLAPELSIFFRDDDLTSRREPYQPAAVQRVGPYDDLRREFLQHWIEVALMDRHSKG